MATHAPNTIRPTLPNAGIEVWYRKKLLALVDEMSASSLYWLRAAYRKGESQITLATDAKDDKEGWVTLKSGVKVMLDGQGNIIKGPAGLTGQKVSNIKTSGGGGKYSGTPSKSLDVYKAQNGGDHVKAARDFYRNELQGKYVEAYMGELGQQRVEFAGSGWQEVKRNMQANPIRAELVPHLPEIISNGEYMGSGPARPEHQPTVRFHTFRHTVQVNNVEGIIPPGQTKAPATISRRVMVDVGERPNGKFFYSLNDEGSRTFAAKERHFQGGNDNGNMQAAHLLAISVPQDMSLGGHTVFPTAHNLNIALDFASVNIRIAGYQPKAEPAPVIALDEAPTGRLERELRELFKAWGKDFDRKAKELARAFTKRANANATASFKGALKDAGFTVSISNSRRTQEVLKSIVGENVGLIKSIPQQYFSQLNNIVMSSVRSGRDLDFVVEQIESRYPITRKRAIMIARDQNNKATEGITLQRNLDLGISEGVWMHRPGSKVPRGSHLLMNGEIFRLNEGCYDSNEGRNVMPGELVNCHCTFKPVIPGIQQKTKAA